MTEALRRMVEAMGAEFNRQAAESRDDEDFSCDTGAHAEWRLDGRFDLEKVARAGLEALLTGEGLTATLDARPIGGNAAQAHALAARLVDAILKDEP